MYRRLLVPTDGSETALAAGETAIELAKLVHAEIHVISVADTGDLPTLTDEMREDLRAYSGEAVEAVADLAREAGIETTTEIEDGDPVECLLAAAEANAVDLVVMGTHGRSGLGRLALGSITERTLRTSSVPVMTVREETALAPVESILVPTDGSACANRALDHAAALAVETDAALHIVHVVDVSVVARDIDATPVLDALEVAGERALEAATSRATDAGVTSVQASVVSGRPNRSVCTYAETQDIDLVVMGTHGRTGLSEKLLGSVTERVVRESPVPVITLRAVED